MIEKDLGFVLKRRNFRETSVIASLYTLRFGKITGIFKGFYTLKKEFSSSLDICTLNEFIFYPKKREIWLISFADLLCDYSFLRNSYARSKVGGIFLTLIDRTMQLWDRNEAVFSLLRDSLSWLGREKEQKVLFIFLIKFLTLSGFKPEFDRCIVCHKHLGQDIFFSVSKGGLVCFSCRRAAADCRPISKETSRSLFYIQQTDFEAVCRLNTTPRCNKEIFYLLREFIFYHLDFDISSKLTFNNGYRKTEVAS